jgi:hypothetical protein
MKIGCRDRATTLAWVLCLALAGCAIVRRVHPVRDEVPWPWAESRAAYVRRSQVWLGRDLPSWVDRMRSFDLLQAPAGDGNFPREDLVRCTFVPPASGAFSGNTPKFLCREEGRGAADVFKVKWGAENAELYAEIAGNRLFWALGFGADREYPVRVECTDCAADPWRDPTPHPGETRTFAPALIERQLSGDPIEEWKHQGWTWAELDTIDPAAGGAPRAQVDAFKLLAAFVQHRDSKADNQRLVCLPGGESTDGTRRTCRRPFMLIDDLGSVFGGPALFATHKMTLDAWERRPVWKDARHCIAEVTSELDAADGLVRPHIGEDGRRFLATLLSALDERQIRALFTAARADQRGGVERWVAAFLRRREQIVHPVPEDATFRCPEANNSTLVNG